EVPHRVGYLEAIRLQNAADCLLLLGSTDLAYSPSKVYLYYLSRRPIVALVFAGSVMERLLEELQCAHRVHFSLGGDTAEARRRVEALFDGLLDGFPAAEHPPRNDALFESRYLAEE